MGKHMETWDKQGERENGIMPHEVDCFEIWKAGTGIRTSTGFFLDIPMPHLSRTIFPSRQSLLHRVLLHPPISSAAHERVLAAAISYARDSVRGCRRAYFCGWGRYHLFLLQLRQQVVYALGSPFRCEASARHQGSSPFMRIFG